MLQHDRLITWGEDQAPERLDDNLTTMLAPSSFAYCCAVDRSVSSSRYLAAVSDRQPYGHRMGEIGGWRTHTFAIARIREARVTK